MYGGLPIFMGICLAFLAVVQAQQLPLYLQRSWFYATPWRPLIAPQMPNITTLDTRQLSLGYTGPQTFPEQAQQQDQTLARTIRRPVLLRGFIGAKAANGARDAMQTPFTLPFRPSPFAGYTNDGMTVGKQQQRQAFEPLFYAPGYPQAVASSTKTVAQHHGNHKQQQQQQQQQQKHYFYLSTGNMYNLVRS